MKSLFALFSFGLLCMSCSLYGQSYPRFDSTFNGTGMLTVCYSCSSQPINNNVGGGNTLDKLYIQSPTQHHRSIFTFNGPAGGFNRKAMHDDGSLDSSYLYDQFWGTSVSYLQPDDKMLALSVTYSYYPIPGDYYIVQRYLSNSQPDSSFGVNGVAFIPVQYVSVASQHIYADRPGAITQLPDGKILFSAAPANTATVTWPISIRLLADGALDNSYGANGVIKYEGSPCQYCQLQFTSIIYSNADTCIYFGGNAVAYQAISPVIYKCKPNGLIDSSYGTNGYMLTQMQSPLNSILLDKNNKLIVLGYDNIQRITHAGTPDTTFGVHGNFVMSNPYTVTTTYNDITVDDSNKFWLYGSVYPVGQYPSNNKFMVVRMTSDGKIDSSFGSYGRFEYVGQSLFSFAVSNHAAARIRVTHKNKKLLLFANYTLGANGPNIILTRLNLGLYAPIDFLTPLTRCAGDTVVLSCNSPNAKHWYRNGTMLPDTSQLLHVTDSGTYYVSVTLSTTEHDTSEAYHVYFYPLPQPVITQIAADTIYTSCQGISYQWYNAITNQPVASADSNKMHVGASGIFYVMVTDSLGCTGRSADFAFNKLDVQQSFVQRGLLVYPNPASQYLHITNLTSEPMNIEVQNVSGSTMVKTQLLPGAREFSLKQLSSGLYIIKYENGVACGVAKIVVQ